MSVSTRADITEESSVSVSTKGKILLEQEIPSCENFVRPLTFRIVEFLVRESLIDESWRERVQLVTTEALRNAVIHGNGRDFFRSVRVRVFANTDEWGLLVEDEGGGFDLNGVPDPLGEEGVWGESGRGLSIMGHYMDRVEYRCGGTALLVIKKRHSEKG